MTTDALVVDVTLVEINALIAQLEHELARVPASAASAAGAAALVPAASVPAATAEGDTLAATTTKRASWPAKLRQQLAEWTAASPAAAATTGGTASTFSSSLSLLRNSLSSSLSNLRSGSSSASSLYLPPTPPQDAPGAAAVATVQPMPLLRMPTGWVVEVPQTWWTSAVVRVWNENLQPAMMRVAVVLDQARKHVDEVAAKVGVNRGTMGAALAVATLIGVRLVGHRSSSSSTTSRTSASSLVFRFIGSTVGAIARFAVYSTVYSGAYVFFGDKVRQYLSIDPPAADTAPSAASAVVTRPPLSATPDEITKLIVLLQRIKRKNRCVSCAKSPPELKCRCMYHCHGHDKLLCKDCIAGVPEKHCVYCKKSLPDGFQRTSDAPTQVTLTQEQALIVAYFKFL